MSPRRASKANVDRWITSQRWFHRADDDAPPARVTKLTRIGLAAGSPVEVAVATMADGERYQLVQCDDAPDATTQAPVIDALGTFASSGGRSTDGSLQATWVGATPGTAAGRPLGAEQSNTSVVIGGTHVLKVLRRIAPGPHPEVEVGQHLRGSDAPVPALAGWIELALDDQTSAISAVAHDLVPGALDGWGLVLSALAADPTDVLHRLHDLGEAVARLHGALAAPGAGFGTTEFGAPRIAAVAAALSEQPLAAALAQAIGDDTGPAIRHHGDLHLGQTMLGSDGWVILDFEGEPTRSLAERSVHHSPLRDVAGMLRSFSYAAAAHEHTGAGRLTPGWEAGARAAFLDGYLAHVDPALLPRSAAATTQVLMLMELEKVVYEIAYERAHRPDWLPIPLAGLARLLERQP